MYKVNKKDKNKCDGSQRSRYYLTSNGITRQHTLNHYQETDYF